MTREQETVLLCKGIISELPPDQEKACNELAEHLRRVVRQAGNPVGTLAFALVGSELQAEPVQP